MKIIFNYIQAHTEKFCSRPNLRKLLQKIQNGASNENNPYKNSLYGCILPTPETISSFNYQEFPNLNQNDAIQLETNEKCIYDKEIEEWAFPQEKSTKLYKLCEEDYIIVRAYGFPLFEFYKTSWDILPRPIRSEKNMYKNVENLYIHFSYMFYGYYPNDDKSASLFSNYLNRILLQKKTDIHEDFLHNFDLKAREDHIAFLEALEQIPTDVSSLEDFNCMNQNDINQSDDEPNYYNVSEEDEIPSDGLCNFENEEPNVQNQEVFIGERNEMVQNDNVQNEGETSFEIIAEAQKLASEFGNEDLRTDGNRKFEEFMQRLNELKERYEKEKNI